MLDFQSITYEVDGDVAVVTMNSPGNRNALSLTMVEELIAAITAAEAGSRAIVLGAAGSGFSSGANLAQPTTADGRPGRSPLETHFNPLLRVIRAARVPIVTAVRGAAAGAGAPLAFAGDMVVAGESAYFKQAFCRIGLVPDMGTAYMLVRTVGRVRANEMMMFGENLSAHDALAMGLINRVVADNEVDNAARDIARRLAAGPTVALATMRRMAWAASEIDLNEQLDREAELQSRVARSDDFKEGVAAFREKRPPQFTGR